MATDSDGTQGGDSRFFNGPPTPMDLAMARWKAAQKRLGAQEKLLADLALAAAEGRGAPPSEAMLEEMQKLRREVDETLNECLAIVRGMANR
jgi:hypothetical protein